MLPPACSHKIARIAQRQVVMHSTFVRLCLGLQDVAGTAGHMCAWAQQLHMVPKNLIGVRERLKPRWIQAALHPAYTTLYSAAGQPPTYTTIGRCCCLPQMPPRPPASNVG
jgi:hypothetical protein